MTSASCAGALVGRLLDRAAAALFLLRRSQRGSGCGNPGPPVEIPVYRGDRLPNPPGERDAPADAAESSTVVVSRAPLVILAATAVGGAGVSRVCRGGLA